MKGILRRTSIGLVVFASIAIVGTALAWACSEGNKITVVKQSPAPVSGSPGAGPVGTEATLEGESFISGEQVQIYWNELGGKVLATVQVPEGSESFTQTVTIPKAPEDTHTILARTYDAEDGQPYVARTSFVVTQAGAPAGGGGPGGGPPSSTAPGTSPPPTSPGTTPAPVRGGNTNGSTGGAERGGGRDAASVTGPGTGSTESNRAPQAVSPTDVSPGTNGTVEQSNAPALAGSSAPAGSPGASAGSPPPPGGDGDSSGDAGIDGGSASDLSASGDLWGGFSSASPTPSLSGAAAPAADSTSSMTVGLGLLGLGLAALLTGFGAADVRRRRRVPVSAQGRSRQR